MRQEVAVGEYEAYVQRAIEETEAAGANVWSAPDVEREFIIAPEYADAAFESWYAHAAELGFDVPACIQKVRDALGK